MMWQSLLESLLLLDGETYGFRAIYGFFGSFQMVLVSHACLHENFTEYGEFSFCGAGEPSFWVSCYFTTVVATVFGFQFA